MKLILLRLLRNVMRATALLVALNMIGLFLVISFQSSSVSLHTEHVQWACVFLAFLLLRLTLFAENHATTMIIERKLVDRRAAWHEKSGGQ